MSFAFKRKESVADGLCRIARRCIKKALTSCEEEDLESIHTARKEIKKIRALLRLVRQQAGKDCVEQVLDQLREAAGYLAPTRDAHVKAQALEQLLGRRVKRKVPQRFSVLRAELQRDCAEEIGRFRQNKCGRKVRRILRRIPGEFQELQQKGDGWSAIAPGLKKGYEKARKARDYVVKESSAENLHEWRKRVKGLLYNVQLLEPIWPEQMSALAEELETFTELLGDHHDLHMLRQTAIKKSVNPDLEAETPELLALIDARQAELQSKAIKLGNRLLQEKPSDFCDRLHQYWKRWKSKKKGPGQKSQKEQAGALLSHN